MQQVSENQHKGVFAAFLFILIIPVVVYVLALLAYLEIFSLRMPLHTIIMCGILLFFAIFFAPQNEYYVWAKIKKNSTNFENELKEFIKNNSLGIGKEVKANADFDWFLDDFVYKIKPLSFGYIASAVFPMLGILGTFISIALSMPDFASSNSSALENEISSLLSGIATAFYVSIYGIFLTIWWMFFSRLGISKINAFKLHFKLASKKYFWSKEELERVSLLKQHDLMEQNYVLIKQLCDNTFFSELARLHNDKFSSFSKLFSSFEKIAKIHTDLAQKSLELSNNNNQVISTRLNEFTKDIDASVSKMKALKNEMASSFESFKKELETMQEQTIVKSLKESAEILNKQTLKVIEQLNNAKE
ncbi:MotA/TolQ/ExbB proton channel family protein [Campylobacter canadensis]|uniref:MotA/TolQ/ExbB proton channel family protein n=1 Tax=Campylobacter canadensis TaxID=449520 RepID=A0ABS7WRP5_9BACT|nr:MotA/TolQ/ExbB proton channel family protein [Campylobacter canadensis]MBZ7987430.1 MotA/TolQ/ExbB proton channel family protein [Campylobacter canadensis]MBZ7995264.1 MotA/TolQ/ExbB proton channel family protein [Campylobacter canadensis]MBZ7996771.1 MotA/TolQ/ExbB proton channel family protein [Campylobacter canadensis]MBZ7998625.1 MotA/TolQ/ExbB proton channel family protein [Campylobacter canadensis]MBZ8000648.1 MotA/TolQ/ExbB proton channel family protein [Campylobacter canadensis]